MTGQTTARATAPRPIAWRLAAGRPPAAGRPAAALAAVAVTEPFLRECPHCGLLQRVPGLPPSAVGRCIRCHAVLRRHRTDPLGWPLAMAATALALMLVVALLPFMDLRLLGIERATTLVTGPVALEQNGMLPLAALVLATTLLAPIGRMAALAWVLLGLRLRRPPRHLGVVFRWVERLRPWSMVEVFLLGVFVAYTKLIDLARVDVGAACYAMGALMVVMTLTDATLDHEAVWDKLPRRGEAGRGEAGRGEAGRGVEARGVGPGRLVGCPHCALVCPCDEPCCPRCGGDLPLRKPHSISRTTAYLIAAACMYVPANLLPVLTLVQLGQGQPSTIIGGAIELLQAGMWPLALLVFFASITVPLLKVASLTLMLITTRRGSGWWLRGRTKLYGVVDFIGRWSMIDVFVISILTALVHFGYLAQVYPQPGVLAFASVVILTMLAAMAFDPRLMWDAALARHPELAASVARHPRAAAPAPGPAAGPEAAVGQAA